MQTGIHPESKPMKATCSCGKVIKTVSTIGRDIQLDVCSNCHPFYTGKQKVVDTAGRVESFNRRYSRAPAKSKTEQQGQVSEK